VPIAENLVSAGPEASDIGSEETKTTSSKLPGRLYRVEQRRLAPLRVTRHSLFSNPL